MEVSITKMSPNGQIVIPSEIRKDANLSPSTKFLIYNKGDAIMLKRIRGDSLIKSMAVMEKVNKAEKQISKGKYTKASVNSSAEEIDALLMGK